MHQQQIEGESSTSSTLRLLELCWQRAVACPRSEGALAEVFCEAWSLFQPQAVGIPEVLSQEEAESLLAKANSSLGPEMQGYIDRLERGGEAIGWRFVAGATDGRPFRIERPLASPKKILRWCAVHPSGLGGMFTSGLGLIEKCAQRGQALLIDWSGEHLLYQGFGGQNLWEEFFTQPAAALLSPAELEDALASGELEDFHGTPCMATPKVGLPAVHAARGRLLCQRFAWPLPELRAVAWEFAAQEMPGLLTGSGRWLAMHLRRSDKGDEAPENLALREDEILQQALDTCGAWQCTGVYLASDDWQLKCRVRELLEGHGLQVSTYSSLLSPDPASCTHMCRSLQAHRKAWDTLFEVAVMSLCSGLLCTHSFMANMAVYFSHPSYRYRSFWDPLSPAGSTDMMEVIATRAD